MNTEAAPKKEDTRGRAVVRDNHDLGFREVLDHPTAVAKSLKKQRARKTL